MSRLDPIIFITILIVVSTSTNASQSEIEEWKINRLLLPTFPEIQSEAVYSTVTNYGCFDEEIINLALDKHYERIGYMTFKDCNLEDK